MTWRWSVYREPGTYRGDLTVDSTGSPKLQFVAPKVDSPSTVHVLLTVTDNGTPPLTRYGRVVLKLQP